MGVKDLKMMISCGNQHVYEIIKVLTSMYCGAPRLLLGALPSGSTSLCMFRTEVETSLCRPIFTRLLSLLWDMF